MPKRVSRELQRKHKAVAIVRGVGIAHMGREHYPSEPEECHSTRDAASMRTPPGAKLLTPIWRQTYSLGGRPSSARVRS